MTEKGELRLRYIFYFGLALLAAFWSYKSFMVFQAEASFSFSMIFLNGLIFLVLWFLSFPGRSGFVRRNVVLVLVIPAAGVHLTNLFTAMITPGASIFGYTFYLIASTTLLFASYKAGEYEEKLKHLS